MWKSAIAPDSGRTYYWKPGSNQTTWERPADFVDDAGSDAASATKGGSVWKELTTKEGKTYYYNTVTEKTQWDKPAELESSSATAANGNDNQNRQLERRDNFRELAPVKAAPDSGRPSNPWDRNDTAGYRGAAPKKDDERDYDSPEQAEEAFFRFLRSHDIKYDAEWPDVVRAVAREKGFRALKDPQGRRKAFEKYCVEEKVMEKQREQERKQKQREQFMSMLKLHDEITHYTRWKSARSMIEREVIFKNVSTDDERKHMFREYVAELQKRHAQEEAEKRARALAEVSALLHALVDDPQMKWQEAYAKLENNKRFVSEVVHDLSKHDVLRAFDNHIKDMDAEKNETKQRQKQNQFRGQRMARDDFKQLLDEQLKAGHIRATTKWKDFYPHIALDLRYKTLLGMPGSSPIDLFWDVLESEDRRLRSKRNDALDALEAQRYEMTSKTTLEDFRGVLQSHGHTRAMTSNDVLTIYEKLMDKVKRRQEEERALAERDFQDNVDALRSAIKHLRPSIHAEDKYEDVESKIEALPEAKGLDDRARRMAFDKHIKRLQDRARRDRDRDRGSRRSYDDDRDRDRDRRHRTRTRSPELDAYEEDRRRAQADRERAYRRPSFGLTPPPRDRRDDRDRRDRHESIYERERKERELERERNYMSRADPRDRGKVTMLDYGDDDTGDSVPGSVRKRRDSETSMSNKRDSKV